MKIDIVLTDDWELRGNGLGSIERMQISNARHLMDLCERYSFPSTFNVEVLQQFAHKKSVSKYPWFLDLSQKWERCVLEMIRRGHDVQLHTHFQWLDSSYDEQAGWQLSKDWGMTRYDDQVVQDTLGKSKSFLEDLIQIEKPGYQIRCFRAGGWEVAPYGNMGNILSALGIELDYSIVNGLVQDNESISFDYRGLQTPFGPYFANPNDLRKTASYPMGLIEIPTFSGFVTGEDYDGQNLKRMCQFSKLDEHLLNTPSHLIRPYDYNTHPCGRPVFPKIEGGHTASRVSISPEIPQAISGIAPGLIVFDLSQISFVDMVVLWEQVESMAALSHGERVPVILQNHTKYITDFSPIDAFFRSVLSQDHIRVISANDCVVNLLAGEYYINSAMPKINEFPELRDLFLRRLLTLPSANEFHCFEENILPECDAETALRSLMVKHFPRIHDSKIDEETLKKLLIAIFSPSLEGQLRFIDCWNNFYEQLPFENLSSQFSAFFKSYYARIISEQVGVS